ncbi:MAG: thioester reductase domain-containing protein [Novosphingobium sp.]|nr:thioester reductase domain-containing protein [Novosphingobium sp.]
MKHGAEAEAASTQPQYGVSMSTLPELVGTLFAELSANDSEFKAAAPDPAINEAKCRPGLGLAEIVAICMESYAARTALAERERRLVTDPATGRTTREMLRTFAATTYGGLWERAKALAAAWQGLPGRELQADDRLCIIGHGSIDFATVDLAAIHNGTAVVPLQVNAALTQLQAIFDEVEPAWIATSLANLETAVDLVLGGHKPKGLLVFDYCAHADDERERYEAAAARLAANGCADLLTTLDAEVECGRSLPPAPLFTAPGTGQRMCTIYYTSGSTGLPKGAMIPESMLTPMWCVAHAMPMITVLYMPLNHTSGRAGLHATLGSGGTAYFTGKSDLSELFDDLKQVRPTSFSLVPRICELIYQHYKVEFEKRRTGTGGEEALSQKLMEEIRTGLLGGRLLSCNFASAPLAPDLRRFIEACLGFPLMDSYGATEISGAIRNTRIMRPPIIDYKLDDVPELGYFKTDKPHPRGELLLKTGSIMLGYYKRPDVTAKVFDEEGYYKTGDIMAEIGPDQLIYVDRRNNVLKLAQGEFVAVARLEAVFTNGHPLLSQVYLYGTSERAFLVGVVVPNRDALKEMGVPDDEAAIKAALRKAIDEVAAAEQLHSYEVPRDFLVEHEPFSTENGLLAGIGKYQRPKFKERYGASMEALYAGIDAERDRELESLKQEAAGLPVLEVVCRAVAATLGFETDDVAADRTFGDLGGDSLSALSLSLLLEEMFSTEVPVSLINGPTGTLASLAAHVEQARDGGSARPTFATVHPGGAEDIRAGDLTLDKFLDAQTLADAAHALPPARDVRTVLVTGANGFLGRFLCLAWLERMAEVDGKVVCVARGRDDAAARARIAEVFDSGDAGLKRHFDTLAAGHLEVLAGDLAEPSMGLAPSDWERLAQEVDLIVHPAAFVNHVLPYAQLFGPNVVGTAEIVRLAVTHRLKPVTNISTMAAAYGANGVIGEDADIRQAIPTQAQDEQRYAAGYAISKWAGEVLLHEANEQFGLPVATFRSDMILAHSSYRGQMNLPDMFTRWLLSIVVTGLAPRSFYAGEGNPHYSGLPVDFLAEAVATLGGQVREGYHTFHMLNPHDDGISLDSFVDWLIEAGEPIRRIDDYDDWLDRFSTALRALPENQRQHTSLPLIHQFARPMPAALSTYFDASRFEAAVGAADTLDGIPHLTPGYIAKCITDVRNAGLA